MRPEPVQRVNSWYGETSTPMLKRWKPNPRCASAEQQAGQQALPLNGRMTLPREGLCALVEPGPLQWPPLGPPASTICSLEMI